MKLNADLTERAHRETSQMEWTASPSDGVWRKRLDREGDEVARATSLVKFDPGAGFPHHVHGGGEEFLVLEGTFSDASGDFEEGTYVRHPIDSEHAPWSDEGCVILVKLRQMHDPDEETLVVDTAARDWTDGPYHAARQKELFAADSGEVVRLERWEPGFGPGEVIYPGGAEFFVLEGRFADETDTYETGDWLRLPPGASHYPRSEEGATIWTKKGHLTRDIEACGGREAV